MPARTVTSASWWIDRRDTDPADLEELLADVSANAGRARRVRTRTDVPTQVDALHTHQETLLAEGMPQRLLPGRAAAEYLGVSRATVERLVFRGGCRL